MDQNPYAAPKADLAQAPSDDANTAIRQAHLHTEVSIKGVGSLYMVGAVLSLVPAALVVSAMFAAKSINVYLIISLIMPFVIAALLGASGFGLRRLTPWSRIIATVGSVVGLIGFPIGTIICGYILYLLWGEKGRVVFSPAYVEVIAATPHLKYKTSIVVLILLGLLGLLIATLIVLMTIRS